MSAGLPAVGWRQWATAGLSLVVFGVVIYGLHGALAQYSLKQVLHELQAIPQGKIALALGLTLVSYSFLAVVDWLGVRYVQALKARADELERATLGVGQGVEAPVPGQEPASATGDAPPRLRFRRIAITSFVAYAFGHNLGLAAFTAAAVRYRMYSVQGLGALEVGGVATFCTLTTGLGLGFVIAAALLLGAPGSTGLHLGPGWTQALACVLLVVLTTYVLWAAFGRGLLRYRSFELAPPGYAIALPQFVVAITETIVAAAVVHALLPDSAPDLVTFTGVYAIAILTGLISQVPGGLGVFEAMLIYALPQVPVPQLLGALLAYRAIYFLGPLLLAAVAMVLHELHLHRAKFRLADGGPARWITPVLQPIAAQLIAVLVFFVGAMLLVSGASLRVDATLPWLGVSIPLPVLELAHLGASAIGVGLMLLARGLLARAETAFLYTRALLLAGIALALLKGFAVAEAALLAVVLGALALSRPGFTEPGRVLQRPLPPAWVASVGIVVAFTVWMGLFAHRHAHYTHALWAHFSLQGHAARMLRASAAAVFTGGGAVLVHLLRPAARDG
jgi:phosphatidylglycerol lysyltransferase